MKELGILFVTFFKMGLFTIGGGLAMLPLIQHTVVDQKKWLSEEEMADCIAVSQALPGVIAINAATYIGKRRKGLPGSLAASFGVILPSFLIIIAAVTLLLQVGPNRYVEGAFTAIKAASSGLIAYAGYRMAKRVVRNKVEWTIFLGSLVAVAVFGVTAIWPVLVGGFLGWASGRMTK